MKILSLTAGAANMYCGSCLRDNSLARELRRLGHDVTLIPVYTPTRTDEDNETRGAPVLFGGISVYLQQQSTLFRHTPWLLDKLWDSRWALKAAAKRSLAVDPKFLGSMTVSMLEGEDGSIAKEFLKLQDWLMHQPRPEIIHLPNTLLIAMASSIKRVYDGPVCSTLQGEDLFLQGLLEPYRSRALHLIRQHIHSVDAFVSVSAAYAGEMSAYLGIPREKIHTVPLGIELSDFRRAERKSAPWTLGYLARIAPEKGLHLLAEAWLRFREQDQAPARLAVAGYLAPEHQPYLDAIMRQMSERGLSADFQYHGELDRAAKVDFLASLDAFCVPPAYDDPKAIYLLEAQAAGVPVIAPARGALPEHLELTRGGLSIPPDDPQALAGAIARLRGDPAFASTLAASGYDGVRQHYSLRAEAEKIVALYQSILQPVSA